MNSATGWVFEMFAPRSVLPRERMSGNKMDKDVLLQELIKSWQESPQPTFKFSSYFPAYAEMFGHLVGKKCVFIETGILDGGSLFMWRKWLGPDARIIGVDLNPGAAKWRDSGFEIFIGDQGDPEFWRKTLAEIGEFDVLLDDGGHQSFQQIVTVVEAIKSAKKDCMVVIEDTLCSFMTDFASHGRRSFLEYAKDATDVLTARSAQMYSGRIPPVLNAALMEQMQNVQSIRFYNSIVAFYLSKHASEKVELLRNREPVGASDFRYEGAESADVIWPSPFSQDSRVTVRGGMVFAERFVAGLKSKLPVGLKQVIKNILGRA